MTAPRSRKPLPGYPKSFKFQSREDLEEYLSGDRITCLLCGRSFKSLNTHLKIHDTNEAEYKETFDIPWRTGLQSAATKARRDSAAQERLKRPGERARLDSIRKQNASKRIEAAKNARPKAGFLIEEYTDRAIGIHGKSELFDKQAYLNALEDGMTMREAAKHLGYGMTAVHRYKSEDPAFAEMVRRTIEAQPFSVQARGEALGERFERELRKLFDQGYSDHEAAHKLGVTAMTCNRRTKAWRALCAGGAERHDNPRG